MSKFEDEDRQRANVSMSIAFVALIMKKKKKVEGRTSIRKATTTVIIAIDSKNGRCKRG
jgi:hypothetical protein